MSDLNYFFNLSDFEAMILLPVGTELFFAVVRQAVKPAPPKVLAFFPGFINIGQIGGDIGHLFLGHEGCRPVRSQPLPAWRTILLTFLIYLWDTTLA